MKLYTAGPITGQPNGNRTAFAAAASALRTVGFEVVNPHELGHPPNVTWRQAMRTDLAALVMCDGVAQLDDWVLSNGARLEHHIAHQLEMPSRYVVEWLRLAVVKVDAVIAPAGSPS